VKCPKCGYDIPNGAKFCPNCGVKLEARVGGDFILKPGCVVAAGYLAIILGALDLAVGLAFFYLSGFMESFVRSLAEQIKYTQPPPAQVTTSLLTLNTISLGACIVGLILIVGGGYLLELRKVGAVMAIATSLAGLALTLLIALSVRSVTANFSLVLSLIEAATLVVLVAMGWKYLR